MDNKEIAILPRLFYTDLTKSLKDQLLLVLSNATACVLNAKLHHVHAHPSSRQGLDCHPDVPLCRELQGVAQQVEDDLQQRQL